MYGLFDYTINSREDLKYISKDSKIRNLYINYNCKLDGYYCCNMYVNTNVEIFNCIIEESLIKTNPNKFSLIRNCMIGDVLIEGIGSFNSSLHIEHNIIYDSINLNNFNCLNKNVTIYIYQNEINGIVKINNNVNSLSDCAICVIANRFAEKSTKYIIAEQPEFIDVRDNYIIDDYKINFLKLKEFENYSGYDRSYLGNSLSLFVYENNYRRKQVTPNKILKVKNIPQYISNENDPALKTGCEATACAILLSYILDKSITKNEMASYMKMGEPGKDSFWDSFIGDIYNDGWGCMSSVSVNAINNYLKANNLQDKYYVINTTNMPLYELLSFVSSGTPAIVWCTMGNKERMYHKKHGSTIWDINGKRLYWPGNDHSLVIVGYSFTYGKIYLADPEENSERITDRDIYEFENRFTELYSQSILVLKKRTTR